MLMGESIVVFNPKLAENLKYFRKQGMQLMSKMRFISAQFSAYLKNDLWRKNASHANKMASFMAEQLSQFRDVTIPRPVEANGVFAVLPKNLIPKLREKYFFYVWNESTGEVRLMTSFDTQLSDIDTFVATVKDLLNQ